MQRGTFGFKVSDAGNLVDCAANVERLRRLWLDRSMIQGDDLGEGDPGDFDFGSWHIACHLLPAGGVLRSSDGRLVWLEISHKGTIDEYAATVTVKDKVGTQTLPLDSAQARTLIPNSSLLGFVEGNSHGRTSARNVRDEPPRFNLWRRQDFDQPIESPKDGGKVWEHWCTTRDIRPSSRIGTSVLSAYIGLVSVLGDLFPAMVARGRIDNAHPKQLCALIDAGFAGEASGLREFTPTPIPIWAEGLFKQAQPSLALDAAESLNWDESPRYFMFQRRIDRWCSANVLREELEKVK